MSDTEKTDLEGVKDEVVYRLVNLRKLYKDLLVQKNDLLKRLDNAAAAKEDEKNIKEIIHSKEEEIRDEIERKCKEIKADIQIYKAKHRKELIESQNFFVEYDKSMKDSYSQLQSDFPQLEVDPDAYKPTDEQTKQLIKRIIEDAYKSDIKLAKTQISTLKNPLRKYAWKRNASFFTQQGFRIICNLIILNLVVNALITKVDPWYLNLIILPAVFWFILEYFVQPWLEKHLFSPQRLKAEKELIEGFYDATAKIRCQQAMSESYSFVVNALKQEKINKNEEEGLNGLLTDLYPVVAYIYQTRWTFSY